MKARSSKGGTASNLARWVARWYGAPRRGGRSGRLTCKLPRSNPAGNCKAAVPVIGMCRRAGLPRPIGVLPTSRYPETMPPSRRRRTVLVAALTACAGHSASAPQAAAPIPSAVAAELLAADRAFAAAAERTDPAAALAPMLASDVVMRVPGGFAKGRDSALAAIKASPVTGAAGARLGWTPIRVGVSGDGRQGFTLGYTAVH